MFAFPPPGIMARSAPLFQKSRSGPSYCTQAGLQPVSPAVPACGSTLFSFTAAILLTIRLGLGLASSPRSYLENSLL